MELTLERKKRPGYQRIDNVQFVIPEHRKLDNGLSLYAINSGNLDLLRIELIFPAGIWYQEKPLQAHATNNLLINGTRNYSANQIAEILDYYGAFLETKSQRDNAYLTLYCLNKHVGTLLPLLEAFF